MDDDSKQQDTAAEANASKLTHSAKKIEPLAKPADSTGVKKPETSTASPEQKISGQNLDTVSKGIGDTASDLLENQKTEKTIDEESIKYQQHLDELVVEEKYFLPIKQKHHWDIQETIKIIIALVGASIVGYLGYILTGSI